MLNTAGTLAAIVGTVGAGFFVELVGSFRGLLMLTSHLYFLAALFYNIFSTGENEFSLSWSVSFFSRLLSWINLLLS
jgi:hypothetical protein